MTTTILSSNDWSRDKACSGKKAYESRRDARKAADESAATYGQSKRAWGTYRCWFCGDWHCGHKGRDPR